ncbi:MAG TPA: hypothetical protein VIZ90_09915, partial [Rhizobiaceae bacterium]
MTRAAAKDGSERTTGAPWRGSLLALFLAAGAITLQGGAIDIDAWAVDGSLNGCEGETGTLSFACGEFAHAYSDEDTAPQS